MIKRTVSVILALLLVFAAGQFAFAADVASTGGDTEPAVISFDTTSALDWNGFTYVGFHIWECGGEPFNDWGGKKERGTNSGDGVWSYDLAAKGLTLDPEKQYGVIFYNDKGQQTYDLLFDTTCFGDTAYCDTSEVFENPVDSMKTASPTYWTNQDPAVNGPQMQISSIGNVVGSCCPRSTTPQYMLKNFLLNTIANTREFTDMSDQEIIDNIGDGLGLTATEVEAVIESSGVETEWKFDDSTLPAGEPPVEDPTDYPIDGGSKEYPVKVEVKSGSGEAFSDKATVEISIGVSPEYAYDTVTLTAIPEEGERFVGWDIFGGYSIIGDGSLDDAELTLRVTGGITAHAYFTDAEPVPGGPDFYRVTADVTEGKGSADISKGIVSFSGGVAPEYAYDIVTLSATPDYGYRFAGWDIEGEYSLDDGAALTDAVLTVKARGAIKAHAKFKTADESVRGDADGDGEVTILDATRIQRYVAEIIGEDGLDIAAADADGDGEVTILDATRIQRVIAELCDIDGNPTSGGEEEPTEVPAVKPTEEYELPYVPIQ